MVFIGIDPGLGGAFAAVKESGELVDVRDAIVVKTKRGHEYMARLMAQEMIVLAECADSCGSGKAFVVLEQQQSMPKQGVRSTFMTGRGFGIWEGILAGSGLSYELVHPRTWKAAMGLSADKGKVVAYCRRMYPNAPLQRVKDHGRAEAILLAEWCRRRYQGSKLGG